MLTSSISSQLYYTNHSLQGKNVKFLLLSTLSLILMENTTELAKKSKVWVCCGTSNAAFVPSPVCPQHSGPSLFELEFRISCGICIPKYLSWFGGFVFPSDTFQEFAFVTICQTQAAKLAQTCQEICLVSHT